MKRLLLAPLLLTLLFGCSNKNDIISNKNEIIYLQCNLDEISYDNKNYIYKESGLDENTKITVNTKTEEATWYAEWLMETPPQDFENVDITPTLIFLKEKSPGLIKRSYTSSSAPYFLNDNFYKINRINGEIIKTTESTDFDKNQKPTNVIKYFWKRGECIVSEDVETLF